MKARAIDARVSSFINEGCTTTKAVVSEGGLHRSSVE
jgi:hypothetical protein